MSAGTDPVGRTCPHCGSTVTSEDFFCRACYKRFELRGAGTDPTKLMTLPEGSVLSIRNPVLAALLSLAGIGLGQFYNGDTLKGLVFCTVWLFTPVLPSLIAIPSLPLPGLLGAALIISLIDAALSAWRINRLVREFSGTSLLFYAELLVFAGLAGWYFTGGDALSWAGYVSPAAEFFR